MRASVGESGGTRAGADVDGLAAGVLSGSRTSLGRAITLVESSRPDHRRQARALLAALYPARTRSSASVIRVGITGPPGVGKSTFVDALGSRLTAAGHRVAVLAVDPSSTRSGGSILGDRTRMVRLSTSDSAFVRPSPAAGTLGGVTRATRESMAVLEAAGYDVVLVETVGVGQSETAVSEMVDTFLLLAPARSGDSLQGIKKGVVELADVVAVTKADGDHRADAVRAARELDSALRLIGADDTGWRAPVVTCSALEDSGVDDVWARVLDHRSHLLAAGELLGRRRRQLVGWTRSLVRDGLLARLDDEGTADLTAQLEAQVADGDLSPPEAADQILAALTTPPHSSHPHQTPDFEPESDPLSGQNPGSDR